MSEWSSLHTRSHFERYPKRENTPNMTRTSAPTTQHALIPRRTLTFKSRRGSLGSLGAAGDKTTGPQTTRHFTHARDAQQHTLLGGKRTSSGVTPVLVLIGSSQGRTTVGPLSCSPTAPPTTWIPAALVVKELLPFVSRGFGTGMLPRYLGESTSKSVGSGA